MNCRECHKRIWLTKDGKWALLSKRCYEHWKAYNRSKHKLHYTRHRDKELVRNKAYREANAERERVKRKAAWAKERLLPPEKRYSHQWRQKNKAKMRRYWRTARERALAKNPRFYADEAMARRARKFGAAGRHTKDEWKKLIVEFRYRCAYCGVDGTLTEDHLVPLARGGSDFIENIVPACRDCNESKGARDTLTFIKRRVRDKSRAADLVKRLEIALQSATQRPIPKWVKVTDAALMVELGRLAETHGVLSWIIVKKHAKYALSTFRRRVLDPAATAKSFGVQWVDARVGPRV